MQLGVKKVISNEKLDLENVPPYLHEKFRELFKQLSQQGYGSLKIE
ncbi:MAG: hypothetical protein HYS07_10075 [Chlamydiae bacterium]|nr:hypothetical protein [Chlamydiota bacterium]MBI3276818.1 hypothetical protein [Chlamydiota bacterium]